MSLSRDAVFDIAFAGGMIPSLRQCIAHAGAKRYNNLTEEAKSQLPVKRRLLVVTGTMTLAATAIFVAISKFRVVPPDE